MSTASTSNADTAPIAGPVSGLASDVPTVTTSADSPKQVPGVRAKRWTREEYHRLGEQGWFDNQQVELIGGEIIEVSPQSHAHFYSIEIVRRMIEEVFPCDRYWIRLQGPIGVDKTSEPEPDIAVIKGSLQSFDAHPSTALLAIEVSKTTQAMDKQVKPSLYASAKIEDYWVLDLERRELTVFRKPIEDAASPFGWIYSLTEVIPETGEVTPLAAPEGASKSPLAVAAMLPPVVSENS